MDMLRVCTAGSVDDGKSTLIGRLLLDTRSVPSDQLQAVEGASRRWGLKSTELALLTDGLKAEREQKITIDVAYRYFSTARRRFILADTPGHLQYTRNMVTGASNADVAIVLVDVAKGVVSQTRRHCFLVGLLGVQRIIVAVNKIDTVNYSLQRFEEVAEQVGRLVAQIKAPPATIIPLSALEGDNVVTRSSRMPWYEGGSLLQELEDIQLQRPPHDRRFRMAVQTVLRPDSDFRGLAGQIVAGQIQVGDEVLALPQGLSTRVKSLFHHGQERAQLQTGQSIVMVLEDDIDVGRGAIMVRPYALPRVERQLEATLCWMGQAALRPGRTYLLRHTTSEVRGRISAIHYRIDIDTFQRKPSDRLSLNDIGSVGIDLEAPLVLDDYRDLRATGGFIVICPETFVTLAAGMVRPRDGSGWERDVFVRRASSNVTPIPAGISAPERLRRQGHRGAVVWLTGLSGSGKTTLARLLERRLFEEGYSVVLLDGGDLRSGLNSDLEFSDYERQENVRRTAEVARLFVENGTVAICSLISPHEGGRQFARSRVAAESFLLAYLKCPVEVCAQRDARCLYAQARRGEIDNFTAIHSPYEEPEGADLVLDSHHFPPEALLVKLHSVLLERIIRPA